jgi:hypothetical protein
MDGNTFLPTANSNTRTGEWWLTRAASVWQHYGEAANRDGYPKLGYAIVNNGIRSTYTPPNAPSNVTNIMQTFLPPPYDFDARMGDNPQFRAIWRDMAGLRGRASLRALPVVGDSTISVENILTDECALELAYEGQRWSDLLRIAIRRSDPSYIASRVGNKLRKDGSGYAGSAEARLSAGEYYLPFKWK